MNKTLDRSNSKSKSKKRMSHINKFDNPWDAAIEQARQRIADLRFSIRDFQKRKDRGDKWLGVA